MDTIYTFRGWVKKVINNENAKVIENMEIYAVGEKGREFLLALAEKHLDTWNNIYIANNKRYKVGIACTVYSNKVHEDTGLIGREKTVFTKLIKTPIKNRTNGNNR